MAINGSNNQTALARDERGRWRKDFRWSWSAARIAQ